MADVENRDVAEFENPYPGARPLGPTEGGLLLGRDAILRDLLDAISGLRVVEFTAPSGLGKSSLLDAGVLPALVDQGFVVAPLNSWAELDPPKEDNDATQLQIANYYADALRVAVRKGGVDGGGLRGLELVDFVSRKYGSSLVVIFDQFEELLRDDPTLGRLFLEEVVVAARERPFHQVISMRSEFKEELRAVEQTLRYNQWRWISLDDVEESWAADIIVAPLAKFGDTPPFSWDKRAVGCICEWWKAARKRDWKVGLLHLQAFLWSVVQELKPSGVIIEDAVRERVARWLAPPRPSGKEPDPLAVFRRALTVYVDLRLGVPSETGDANRRQALYAASRYSAELSSAGYKLVRDTLELGRFAFPGVKSELGFSDAFIEEAVRTAEQLVLTGNKSILDDLATVLPTRLEEDHKSRKLELETGEADGTAGAMATSRALDAACSEIAAYERSLQLLSAKALVRLTPTLGGGRRVALIHDGFGDAIDAWGKKVGADPLLAIESTTALSAKQLLKNLGDSGFDSSRLAITKAKAVEHVRWISCYITANIRDITFKNCRFASTLFKDCVFENVRFENCELRGALFLGCTFRGERGTVVEVDNESARERCRISALTLKECGMAEGGLTFAGMVGSGLLFEQCYGGPWKLVRCNVRHVALDGASVRPANTAPLHGTIDTCDMIRHLSVQGDVGEKTVIIDSRIRLASYPPGHKLDGDPKSDVELQTTERE